MHDLELEITGMTCASCARHVERALTEAGAEEAAVDWRRGYATASGAVDEQALEETFAGTPYAARRLRKRVPAAGPNGTSPARDYDLVVIGSGGGAFAGAIRARDLGKRVLMVERGMTGGTCVNIGCIPSKALLVSSERARLVGKPPLAEAVARKTALVERLRQSKYVDLLDQYGIEFRRAPARLSDPHTVSLDGETVTADAILIGAGARPAVPPIAGLEEAGFLTSTTALDVTEPPKRLAVLGAGPVGLELGQMFGHFGAEVTFVARRGVAPDAEAEASATLRGVLESEGHHVLAPASTSEVAVEGAEKVLRGALGEQPFELRVDEVLVATGRQPNTDDLGLSEVGVERDSTGAIVVDEQQRTSVPTVFAAGDVTTQPRFVYVAAAAGAAAVENALGDGQARLDFSALPQIIFTEPAFAQAGLTEAQARKRGFEVETTVLPLDAVPRALVNGDTRGLFKLVAESDSGRLLGVSIVAGGAPDVIQSAVLGIERGLSVTELSESWAPYLAMAEGLKLAAQTFDRDVSKLSCCAA